MRRQASAILGASAPVPDREAMPPRPTLGLKVKGVWGIAPCGPGRQPESVGSAFPAIEGHVTDERREELRPRAGAAYAAKAKRAAGERPAIEGHVT
ncbi:hypothetical protein amb3217 [Paramagnetospirillum magneticum AMB-1]|uniref:Uncharacterized protein n=1 Tax=Paramagnetospirillum magneticum (strain ATCC 700264 / AMB-1) TaxID=342108 RepID=Q2W2A4_PARM1|nr:hypothetical protein amb3217 [Paramagnetospirillum magneticum AMB-1]